MAFNPKNHMTNLKGKDYLEVKWRLVWFRESHPKGVVMTDVQILTENVTITKTTVMDESGDVLATGIATVRSASGNTSWAGREFEKAETASIGRALAHAGFGSQFDGDDEGDYLSDSPVTNEKSSNVDDITEHVTAQTNVVVTKHSDTSVYMTIEGCRIWSRQPFVELEYNKETYEHLAKEGVTKLSDNIQIVYKNVTKQGKTFKEALRIQRVKTGKVVVIKENK